ncbi:MAG: hypothetical protein ACRDTQ_14680 [Micromonosporaceae bacterium]
MSMATHVELDAAWGRDAWFRFPNAFVRDSRLSWNARGIAAWMASHDPGFSISVKRIISAGPLGRDGVYAALKQLEDFGYLTRRQGRRQDGALGPVTFCLRPEPSDTKRTHGSEQTRRSEPLPDFPEAGNKPEQTRRSQPLPGFPYTANPEAVPIYKKTKDLSLRARDARKHGADLTALIAEATGEDEREADQILQRIRRRCAPRDERSYIRTLINNGDIADFLHQAVDSAAQRPAYAGPTHAFRNDGSGISCECGLPAIHACHKTASAHDAQSPTVNGTQSAIEAQMALSGRSGLGQPESGALLGAQRANRRPAAVGASRVTRQGADHREDGAR